jgi:hypothetical protein
MDRQTSMAKPVSAFLQPVTANEPEMSLRFRYPIDKDMESVCAPKVMDSIPSVFELLNSTAISTGLSDARSNKIYYISHLYLFLKKSSLVTESSSHTQAAELYLIPQNLV